MQLEWPLTTHLASHDTSLDTCHTGRTTSPVAEAILQIWKEIFKLNDINLDSDFFDIGGNSLSAGKLQIALKEKFGVIVRTADIFRHPVLSQLSQKVELAIHKSRREDILASSSNVVPLQPLGEGRPVFVISQSMIFRKLALQLGTDQPVYTIQMNEGDPGSNLLSFEEILDFYLQWIRTVQPNGPYRLAGWCVSGWIAYGIARKLEEQGEKIELLVVIDVMAPGYWSRCGWLTKLAYNWRRFNAARKEASPLQLVLKRFVKTTKSAEEEDADKLDETANQAQFLGPLRGKMLLFCSEDDPINGLPRGLGWEHMLGRQIEAISLPGNHHKIFEDDGVRIMAQAIKNQL